MTRKLVGATLALLSVLALAPAALAGDGTLDECIVTLVAETEGEPMRVEGTLDPAAEDASTAEMRTIAPSAASGPSDLTSESWKFSITPYLWATALKGQVGVRGLEADVDMDFGDLISMANLALALRGEAWYGQLGFSFDVYYVSLTNKAGPPLIETQTDLDMIIAELGVSYMFHWPLTDAPGDQRLLTIEPLLGVRYVGADAKISADLGPVPLASADGKKNWIEPFIGFRTRVQIADRWTAAGGVNFGGFGIGSRLTWEAFLGVDYKVSELISLKLGYKWLDIDYSDGSGTNRFILDATLQGLWLGVSFNF